MLFFLTPNRMNFYLIYLSLIWFVFSCVCLLCVCVLTKTTMGDNSVETLGSKIRFLSVLVTFSPFPQNNVDFSIFFDCTDHSAYTTLNSGAGGIRELTLDANKIEKMLKYRKVSFPKSVSTTFVAHCSCKHMYKLAVFLFLANVFN